MFTIDIRIGINNTELEFKDFRDALIAAEALSEAFKLMGYTRHPSVNGVIRGSNFYGDVYNEASIMLEQVQFSMD